MELYRLAAAPQRRLSRLYNDTKKSSDFVNVNMRDPAWKLAHEDPDIKALHRKMRIQKDRLVTWGLEWSEPGPAPAPGSADDEIDEALSRAGLSEIVGSVMTTIKDILAEVEQRWLAFRRAGGSKGRSDKSGTPPPPADVKVGLLGWDKDRFEDLVRDLTTSIDTLYDLSRTRSTTAGRNAFLTKAKTGDERASAFETSRLQTSQHIDPATLSPLHEIRSPAGQPQTPLREIVIMNRAPSASASVSASSLEQQQQPQRRTGRTSPLLLEYAPFDSIYAMTGIMPPMARFEKVSAALQQETQRSPDSWSGLPALLGYFEDFERSRLGLVYHFPPGFNAVSSEHTTQNTTYGLRTLGDLINRRNFEPRLEAKFRLAHSLANTVFDLHSRATPHGNLHDSTVSFGNTTSTMEPGMLEAEIHIRRPMVSSFELFPDASPDADLDSDPAALLARARRYLYRHPLDPRTTPSSPLSADKTDLRLLDLYSLAMLLLQIGLWTSLENLAPSPSAPVPESMLEQLAVRCGSLYMKAVKVCWTAVDEELAGKTTGDALLYSVQSKTSRYLEACCILDGVTGLEERLGHDLSSVSPTSSPPPPATRAGADEPAASSSRAVLLGEQQGLGVRGGVVRGPRPQPQPQPRSRPSSEPSVALPEAASETAQLIPKPKSRIYDHVPLPPEALQLWNTVTMHRVNTALRSFYRKNAAESVEVSLASVGPSAQQTVPTVLVVCTSVAKVRAILKTKLADLFDGASASLALKVCRGSVVRSRKSDAPGSTASSPTRASHPSTPEPDRASASQEVVPVNPHFQKIPRNGASIGAWIGTRHLPPVSLGGLVVVDNKMYGMTVHHMLDDPDAGISTAPNPAYRSSAWQRYPSMDQMLDRDGEEFATSSYEGSDYGVDLSDTDSETYSQTDATSDFGSESEHEGHEDDSEGEFEPGDIVGIEPDCDDGYIITQPALDDVEDGFYPSDETADEDHIDTFSVGDVYASSGIRRRRQDGFVHEIDWALFQFTDDERLPSTNAMPLAHHPHTPKHTKRTPGSSADMTPTTIAPMTALPGLAVQCIGRTSGLQTGTILPALTSVKIHGRVSPSHTFQVSSSSPSSSSSLATGLPGDSGAWIVAIPSGAVCGHVLAWSERKRVAYMCPMDVLLQDVADTLCAREIRLPGGKVLVRGASGKGVRGSIVVEEGGLTSDEEEEGGRRAEMVEIRRPGKPAVPPPRRSRRPCREGQLY